LDVPENTLWAQKGIENGRQKGFQWRKDIEQAVTEKRPGTIFRPSDDWIRNNPDKNWLEENNRYKTETERIDPDDAEFDIDPKAYLQRPERYGNIFATDDGLPWYKNVVKNNDEQNAKFDAWREEYRAALKAHNPGKDKEVDRYIDSEVPRGADTDMLEMQIKPHTGGSVIKMSSQGENDFYRARTYRMSDVAGLNKYDFNDLPQGYQRPKFGDGSYSGREHLNWNDHAYAGMVEAAAKEGVALKIGPMGRDNIVTVKSQDSIDAIMQLKGINVGPGTGPVTFTLKKPGPGADNTPDAAAFDAVVDIPQAKGPVQLASNVQKDLPGLTVKEFDITVEPSRNQRGRNYYMVPIIGQ
jgi:hypothetical protein